MFCGVATSSAPWRLDGAGTSYLCVKSPVQRAPAQSTGGTALQCDGSLSFDWDAIQLAYPGALGSPWSVGSQDFVPRWYRDPPVCPATGLTNALRLTIMP